MNSVRFTSLIALLSGLVLFASGCGASTPGSGDAAAAFAPAGAALFVDVNTDFQSGQWDQVQKLVAKFPDGGRARELLEQAFSDQGVDFNQDIAPAVGPEFGVVALGLKGDRVVGFTRPKDADKLKKAFESGSQPSVTKMIDGWLVVADNQAALDAFEEARKQGSLSDSQDYKDATATVSSDALATLYVNGKALQQAFESNPAVPNGFYKSFLPGGEASSFALSVRAEDNGVRLQGGGKTTAEGSGLSTPYVPELPNAVPAGALAYLSFNNLERAIANLRDAAGQANPQLEGGIGQIEALLGVSLDKDIAPLFAHEGAIYVRAGAPIPEVTLLLNVDDPAKAVATLDKLLSGLRAFSSQVPAPKETEISGVTAREISAGLPVSVFYAGFDGHLVVTSSRQGIADLRSQDDRLASDPAFTDARDAVGMPDEVTGFLYVNLQELVPFVLGYLEGAGVPEEVRRNLDPLRYLVLYAAQDGDTSKTNGFLAIK